MKMVEFLTCIYSQRQIFHVQKKTRCCHILAVEYTNEKPSIDSYKIQNLSKLTRKKNKNKISGKKRTGQASNSVVLSAMTRVTRSISNQ